MHTDSPEDRLLGLIKGKHRKNPDIKKEIFVKNKALRPLFSDSVNAVLIIMSILLAGYLGYNFLFPVHRNVDRLIESAGTSPLVRDIIEKETASLEPPAEDYSAYSKVIKERELFTAPAGEEITGEPKAPDIDISKRFNLVGIIAGDDPQAIIEDTEAKKTHYLYEGQSLNGVTVTEISEGKVILGYGGQEVILVL